jgi:hypothetical protein
MTRGIVYNRVAQHTHTHTTPDTSNRNALCLYVYMHVRNTSVIRDLNASGKHARACDVEMFKES